ncbi:MAG: ATP-binding cassette domain-containing protein [Bacteroidetes bacterium]|nr:ATP-binding cassette domain-containing protein [Bacteroidota bacterium]
MLELRGISKQLEAFSLENISFSVEKGDYFVILGESGAGKSVILELIAGMEKVDSGFIYLNSKNITHQAIQKRGISMVFQDFSIFPHFTVAENIGYALKAGLFSKAEIKQRVLKLAEEMEISNILLRKPKTLSGGELQRVALARALAAEPQLLLLDEPLAAIDVRLQDQLRALLRKLNRKGITIIHVTHDFEEAISLANQIAVIHDGKLICRGTPDVIFQAPNHPFLARFAGIRNFFKATLVYETDTNIATVRLGSGIKINLASDVASGDGYFILPSDEIIITNDQPHSSASNTLKGEIYDIIPSFKGIDIMVNCGEMFHITITKPSKEKLGLEIGKTIWISWKAMNGRFI